MKLSTNDKIFSKNVNFKIHVRCTCYMYMDYEDESNWGACENRITYVCSSYWVTMYICILLCFLPLWTSKPNGRRWFSIFCLIVKNTNQIHGIEVIYKSTYFLMYPSCKAIRDQHSRCAPLRRDVLAIYNRQHPLQITPRDTPWHATSVLMSLWYNS